MENMILSSFIQREPEPLLPEGEAQKWVSMLEDTLHYEYAAMLFYLQASYAVPRKTYYLDYFGEKNKDWHYQLRCHSMHDMRHAEMLGRTIVRLGALPSLQMKTLPPCRTYRDLLVAARKLEEEKLARYGQHLHSFSDKEIYLLISNIMRENEIHAALDDQLIQLLETEGMADRDIPPTQGQGQVAGDVSMLQRAFYLEAYSIINLIYLSICLGPDQSLSPRLRALAIEHMVHLNDIGHEIQDLGALPQVPLQIDFIGSDQFSVQALLEKNIRIMQQKAEEMGSFLPRFQNEKGRNTLGTIIPKELENASDLQAYLGSLNSIRAIH